MRSSQGRDNSLLDMVSFFMFNKPARLDSFAAFTFVFFLIGRRKGGETEGYIVSTYFFPEVQRKNLVSVNFDGVFFKILFHMSECL